MKWTSYVGIYVCHSNLYFIVQKIQEMDIFPRETHIDISTHPIPPGFLIHVKKVLSIKLGKRAINEKQSCIKFI